MKLHISNPIKAIYSNILTLSQNSELQLMAIWVYLSMYLLFAIDLSPSNLFNAKSTVFRTAFIEHADLKSSDKKNSFCLLKEGKTKKKKDFNFT